MTEETHSHHQDDTAATDAILAEAERRIENRNRQDVSESQRAVVEGLNRAVYWLTQHWIAFFNGLLALYLGGTALAPGLLAAGFPGLGRVLYTFYRPFCHQYPFRSWFLFGPEAARPLREAISIGEMNRLSSFIGSPEVGYKMALCERDVAIYGVMLVAGLLYGALRKRLRIPPLPLWLYFLFGIMPMMLDGGVQWISYAVWEFLPGVLEQPFETIPLMRTLTGGLFGLGVTAVVYPYFGEYFEEIRVTLEEKYGW